MIKYTSTAIFPPSKAIITKLYIRKATFYEDFAEFYTTYFKQFGTLFLTTASVATFLGKFPQSNLASIPLK